MGKKMNKTQFDFFLDKEGRIYMQELVTVNGDIILKQMFGNGEHISVNVREIDELYCYINEDEVYAITRKMSDSEYHQFMDFVGNLICPFCGGKLHW